MKDIIKSEDKLAIHKKVKIVELNGEHVEIDAELVPLIMELNRVGLKTAYCCQGGTIRLPKLGDPIPGVDGWAYISFLLGDDCHFDYTVGQKILTLRWRRTKRRLSPERSVIYLD